MNVASPLIQVRVKARSVGPTFATTTYTLTSYQENEGRVFENAKPDRWFPENAAVAEAAAVGSLGVAQFENGVAHFFLRGEKPAVAVCP